MRYILIFSFLFSLISCGNHGNHKPAKPDFIQGKWRKNDEQGYSKGKYGGTTTFMMPTAGYNPVRQSIIVNQRPEMTADCLYGKIYTLDGKLYLHNIYYHVISCEVVRNNEVKVTIEFEDIDAQEVYFEYY